MIQGFSVSTVIGKDGSIILPEKIKNELGIKQGCMIKVELLPDGRLLINLK